VNEYGIMAAGGLQVPTAKKQTAVRLSEDGRRLVERLKQRLGLTVTGVFELAVRRLAEQEKVDADDE
jgi:hypothetical protein